MGRRRCHDGRGGIDDTEGSGAGAGGAESGGHAVCGVDWECAGDHGGGYLCLSDGNVVYISDCKGFSLVSF